MATFLYVMAGWVLFNIVVAVGMYFRPVRKPGPDDPNRPPMRELTGQPSDEANPRSPQRNAVAGKPLPAVLTKLLFFGFWLNDRTSARNAVERETT